jgi:hypothetical protein
MARNGRKQWRKGGRGGKGNKGKASDFPAVPPALERPPRTDLEAHVQQLDKLLFPAIDAVADALYETLEEEHSLDTLQLLMTKRQLLLAMRGTHRSIRKLLTAGDDHELELSVDALPLTRVQLERCFLCLLIQDQPDRWHKRYCKNAWKAFAEKFFRDRAALGHFEQFEDYFGPNGSGISALRAFARQMYVWEDELQTFRAELLGEELDERWKKRFIADMPTPGKAVGLLEEDAHRKLAKVLYPYYDTLSHFSHGGLVGAMEAAILRPGNTVQMSDEFDRRQFWTSSILEMTLPISYVSLLVVATLFASSLADRESVCRLLQAAWKPYHSDGSALGVGVWDTWARNALQAACRSAEV